MLAVVIKYAALKKKINLGTCQFYYRPHLWIHWFKVEKNPLPSMLIN